MTSDLDAIPEAAVRAFNAHDVEGIVAICDPEIVIELFGGFADLMGGGRARGAQPGR